MTFGQQNTMEEGVEQLRIATEQYGINFIDTAEMYPIPTTADTQGRTDRIICEFLKQKYKSRQEYIIATKVCGRSNRINWLPRTTPNTLAEVNSEQIMDSVNASLERLQCDYIDLLQIHWPDRYTGGLFGQIDFTPTQYENAPSPNSFQDQLQGLQNVIQSGKVRYIGLSNETPYGISQFVTLAQQYPDLYSKIISIQNSYSLVVRKDYEAGLGEMNYHYNIGLLAYSPLAGGSLSGKYRNKDISTIQGTGSRLTLFPGFMDRYLGSMNEAAVNAYCDCATKYNLTPSQLALAWCYQNELVASTIIGATTIEQLHENCKAYDIKDQINKNDAILKDIDQIYKQYTDPTKARN
jgi:aryl-alcohol dehydrogenase-like predicted oxidoreductase